MTTKITTQFIIGILFLIVLPSHSQNILTDGDFSKTTEIKVVNSGPPPMKVWYTHINPDLKANASVIENVCSFEITTIGTHLYDVQLMQSGFTLLNSHLYRLSFRVKSDAERTFGVFLGQDSDPWTNLIASDKYVQNSSMEWKIISIVVKVKKMFERNRITFDLGNQNAKTYFDDINLVDLGPIPVPAKRKPQPANLILGEWFPAGTSSGGLGSNFIFLPEGKAEVSFGAFIHFKYRIEGDTIISQFTPTESAKFGYKIDGEKLTLSAGKIGDQQLERISGDPKLGIVGRWTGAYRDTQNKQIIDYTNTQNQYFSVPFNTDIGTYVIKDDSIKISGKQAMSFLWYVETDTLNLVVGDDLQTSKYMRIK